MYSPKKINTVLNPLNSAKENDLRQLAFNNAVQANIIFAVSSGKIIMANRAACKLLGYSNKSLLTKGRSSIFKTRESAFKKAMQQHDADGNTMAMVTAIKKSGKQFPCKLSSAIFTDAAGNKRSITTLEDASADILKQKNIDLAKDKLVSLDILTAKSKQKKIDVKNEKEIARDITEALEVSDGKELQYEQWKKFAGQASYDVMWDWNVITGKIYVGASIAEVFGCKAKNNAIHYRDFLQSLVPEEKKLLQKKLQETLASAQKSWDDTFQVKRNDGSLAATSSRAKIIRDEEGRAVRVVGATKDISRLQEMEKKLKGAAASHNEEAERYLVAAKLSYDVIWDWNLLTNEVSRGEGFNELLGNTEKNNQGNINEWRDRLHKDDKIAVEKSLQDAIASTATHWEYAFRFMRANGSAIRVFDRASIIRDAKGKAFRMIGAMHDLTMQTELEKELHEERNEKSKLQKEYKNNFKLLLNSSADVLFDSDLLANKVIINNAYQKEFGYSVTDNTIDKKDWLAHIHPDDKAAVQQDYNNMLDSVATEWKSNYRFIKADDSIANVVSSRIILRDASGRAYRILGAMHDSSKQKVVEQQLELEIKLKEQQIAEATADAKETERSYLGKELHDNINQLLAASKMCLLMAKRGGKNSEMYLAKTADYTNTAIEEIRKLSKGLTTDAIKDLGLCESVENIIRATMETSSLKIFFTATHFIENSVPEKFKLNLYRIVQEQLNNILKHANATLVTVNLEQDEIAIVLSVTDNGVGFDTAKERKGIGVDNIKSRAAAYRGNAVFISQPGKGCTLNVNFPAAAVTGK